MNRVSFGHWGQNWVEKFFQRQGYLSLDKNFQVNRVEWDLLMWKDGICTFMEVRTRRKARYEDEILFPYRKCQRLWRSAPELLFYIQKEFPGLFCHATQVKLIEVRVVEALIRLRFHEIVDGRSASVNH